MKMHAYLAALAIVAGCQNTTSKTQQLEHLGSGSSSSSTSTVGASPGSTSRAGSGATTAAPAKDIDSKDILARTDVSDDVYVKHVLVGWQDLASVYHGQMDPRAAKRSNAEAAALAQDLAAKLRANPSQIDALVKESSEDPGSQTGDPYEITKDTPFVPEFKKLAQRLKENEVGIVKTQFGYHVIERIPPPPLDPLESADILARPAQPGAAIIQHVMIGWKDAVGAKRVNDPRAMKRTKAEADKLATDLLAKAKSGADFAKLMKENSEDPGTKDDGKTYDVPADSPLPFAKLAVRLKEGEVGLIKSPFGWHVVKRVPAPPPPPPDSLDSVDILKREPPAASVKVKHILLGWKDAHADDPRGKTRDRAALEKLVKETVGKLQKGEKIEPLMKELSEDAGSAKSGEAYPVANDNKMVKPFTDLSLRLKVGEVGVVKSQFGIHIIQRTE